MSAWGKADNKTASGTVAIDTDGVVTGSSTAFTTQASVGDYLRADGKNFIIKAITSDTAATVINADPELGAFTAVSSGTAYTLSEKPTSLASDPNTLASDVFGVRSNEIHGDQSGGYISAVAIIQGGTGYTEVPAVTFTGGGGSSAAATATIANGAVTAITVTNNGSSYETAPTVYVNVPYRTIATTAVNTTAETITYNNHGLTTGDRIRYYVGGGAAIGGLSDATTYYAIVTDANTFKVALNATNAGNGTAINLSGTGNNAQYFDLLDETTATANAALGVNQGDEVGESGAVAHTGWVKRKVLTGAHAGRIQYEVLVALSKNGITGDASDDIQFPED